jgi:hypothetical protein
MQSISSIFVSRYSFSEMEQSEYNLCAGKYIYMLLLEITSHTRTVLFHLSDAIRSPFGEYAMIPISPGE